ncbi:TlpA disulfide reductase family protein [Klenkia sp. LSe6-5]|uniref:TlpA disulfide reductase family protein n=1 Tax=Klenkia sesuvii TaxID=3103137 RepID=A0ABU8DMY1_9ACTN
MRKLALAVLTALAVAGCSTGSGQVDVNNGGEFRFVQGTPSGGVIAEDERQSAPEFSGTLLDGGDWSSDELAGDIAVLNVWASWCAPCRVESPEFERVHQDLRDDGVQFLGLNVKDQQQLAQAFVADKGLTFPSLYDPASEVALAFRDFPTRAIPSTIVLDRQQRVAAVFTAAVSEDDLRSTLDQLLAEG